MKRYLLLILVTFLCLIKNTNAQEWKNELKANESPNFYEVQTVFNNYWKDKSIEQKKKKGSGYKQYKRFEWFWAPRVTKNGEFPANTVLRDEWKKFREVESQSTSARTTEENSWTSLGPSTISSGSGGVGRINCIAFHPIDANTFWIGAPAGGLWKTTDGGTTWATTYDDQPILGVSDIAIHPTDPNIMYLATGDGDSGSFWSVFGGSDSRAGDTNSLGIMKSVDGGNTWSSVLSVNVDSKLLIRRLILDPDAPEYLYAASNAGILFSNNSGVNWYTQQSGNFKDIERHPTDNMIYYASSFGSDAQVFVSVDGGITWSQTSSFTGISRINIEVSPASPDIVRLLCADSDDSGLHGLYASSDKGQSWNQIFDGHTGGNLLGWEEDASDDGGQGNYDLAFAIDPTNVDNMFVGGVVNWKSSDGGSNWELGNFWRGNDIGKPVVHADKHFLMYHPLNNSVLYECNDGGLWKTDDDGATWTNLTDGLAIGQFYDIDVSQADPDKIVGGFQDNGSKLRTTSGWAEASGGDGMTCQIDDQNGKVFTSYVEGVIYRDYWTDNWEVVSENIPGGQPSGEWLTPFELDPADQSIIYAGYDEVYKSTNSGDSWTQMSNFNTGSLLNYLAVQPENTNIIYVGDFSSILKTTDGGSNWADVTAGLPVSSLNISRIIPYGVNSVMVSFSGYNATEKIYYSDDGGVNWINATFTGLPNVPANCTVFDQNAEDVYIGTDLGVFVFDEATQTWMRYGVSMPNVPISDLDIQYSAQKLRAATFGRGLWEADLNTISDVNAPEVSSFSPVNNSTGVLIATDLTISFNEVVQKGTGNLLVKTSSDNATVQTIDVTSNNVSISSSAVTATIADLNYETQYYIEIEATAFIDASGNNYTGIAGNADWSFTTELAPDIESPTVMSLTPSNLAEDILIDAGLAIEFNEDVAVGTGNISIIQVGTQASHEVIDVNTNKVTIEGKTSTIDVTTDFDKNTAYYVEIDAGAFKDLAGNDFTGLAGSDLWKFSTEIILGVSNKEIVADKMFLNYSSNVLKIGFDEDLNFPSNIKVYDIKGELVAFKDNMSPTKGQIVLKKRFTKGIYVVLVVSGSKVYKEKFVSID